MIWYQKAHDRKIKKLGDKELIDKLLIPSTWWQRWCGVVLICFILLLLIIAYANPQYSTKKQKVEIKGTDVFVALDISKSMLAEDVSPSRLERAKHFASSLLEKLTGNRMGIILFAGNAYLQMPLTTDVAASQLFIQNATPEMVPNQGTAIGDAIRMAQQYFGENETYQKALVIITDGETHDQDAIEQAKAATAIGLSVYIVGVGTTDGALIPININGLQDFKRDDSGKPIRTSLDTKMIQEIAAAGNGKSFVLYNPSTLSDEVSEAIYKLEKRSIETKIFRDFENYFQYFVLIAMLLLFLKILLY